jgi:predicted nucleotidyltransferase
VGLNKKSIKHLNSFVRGSFMHITTEHAKDILMKIIDNLPEENEKLLEEETKIAKPKILPDPSQPLALDILDLEPPKEEETPISDFMLEFDDELIDDYGNTSKYHMMKKP